MNDIKMCNFDISFLFHYGKNHITSIDFNETSLGSAIGKFLLIAVLLF